MFRLIEDTLVLAASDITNYLGYEHLFEQRRAVAVRERSKARPIDDPHAELVAKRDRPAGAPTWYRANRRRAPYPS